MSKTRIYVVHDERTDERTLVRAASAAQAERHMTYPRFAAAVATQDQLERMLIAGERVQDAAANQVEKTEPAAPTAESEAVQA